MKSKRHILNGGKSIRKNSRKNSSKSIRKNSRKNSRESIRKNSRKNSHKSVQKNIRKSVRKSRRKNIHKSVRKSRRKSRRKSIKRKSFIRDGTKGTEKFLKFVQNDDDEVIHQFLNDLEKTDSILKTIIKENPKKLKKNVTKMICIIAI